MSKKSIRVIDRTAPNTKQSYKNAIKNYEECHGIDIDALIEEALQEQSEGVPIHQLKLYDRIVQFQDYLIDKGFVFGTINEYQTKIKSLYRKNRVDIPYIPSVDPKQCNHNDYIEYGDILTKDEIKLALSHMSLKCQARAMAMATGGLSNEECEHLTLTNFISDTHRYHQCDDVTKALEWLADESHTIIWVAKLIRVKTGKPYYAMLNPETVQVIAKAKLKENKYSDKLLNTHKTYFAQLCTNLNKKLGFGTAGGKGRFRSHMLRKFNATYLGGSVLSYEEQSIITNAEIDEMQGRGKTAVQDTYIKTNPIRQKVLYAKVMNNVSLFHQYDYEIIGDDVVVTLHDPTSENKKLKEEVKNLKKNIEKRRKASEKVDALRKELGDDAFKELIGEILNAS